MSLIDVVLSRLGYVKAAATTFPAPMLYAAGAERFSVPDGELPEQQARYYERLTWVSIAVRTVSEAVAAQSFAVKRGRGDEAQELDDHEFLALLGKPNPLQGRFEFLNATAAYRRLTGNAYWYLNGPEGGPPTELWVIPSHRIRPIPDGKSYIRGYEYGLDLGRTMELPEWQVVHFKDYHPLNSFVGLSPIEALSTIATADLAMQRWNANFFGKRNAKIEGALSFAEMLDETRWQKLRRDLEEQWGGTNRSGPLMLRGTGQGAINWVAMAVSQKDMEFLAGRQASKEEIFQMFGVPPGMLDKNATEANAQAAKAVFSEYTLHPFLSSLAETITNKLLPLYGEELYGEFDDPRKTDRLIDMQEQQEYSRTHTIDEIRHEYYGDQALGDERGAMLPAEIGPGLSVKMNAPPPAAPVIVSGQPSAVSGQPEEQPPETEPQQEGEQAPEMMTMKALEELKRWHTKSKRRGDVAPFVSADIPPAVRAAVEQNGFDWLARFHAYKAGKEPDRAMEEKLRKRIASILSANGNQWVSAIQDKQVVDLTKTLEQLQAELATSLARAAADDAVAHAAKVGVGFDIVEINHAALDWARKYSYELVKGIEKSTRKLIAQATQQFIATPGMTNEQLTSLLEPAYGPVRAQMIAVTEVTRAYSQGSAIYQDMLKEAGVTMQRVWRTSADERVCPVCGPLEDKPESQWGLAGGPPAHPNCRCWTVLDYP